MEQTEYRPPFPSSSKRATDPASAIKILGKSDPDPHLLLQYFHDKKPRSQVPSSITEFKFGEDRKFTIVPKDGMENDGIEFKITTEGSGEPAASKQSTISKIFKKNEEQKTCVIIPMVKANLLENGTVMAPGQFAYIDLGKPSSRIILTGHLTGCCLMLGWDKANKRLYMGHVKPTNDGKQLAIDLKARGSFKGISLDRSNMFFMGRGNGYNDGESVAIGVVSGHAIYFIFRNIELVNKTETVVVKLWKFS